MFYLKVRSHIRHYIIAGLLVVAPLTVAVLSLWWVYDAITHLVSPGILAVFKYLGLPSPPSFISTMIGIAFIVVAIFFIGLLTTNYVGQRLLRFGENILIQIPLFRTIYSGVKQIIETIASDKKKSFREVVLIEYPRKGLYSIAFVTNDFNEGFHGFGSSGLISLFVPTTPNPTSGMLILVKREDCIFLNVPIDFTIRFIISGGMLDIDNYTQKDAVSFIEKLETKIESMDSDS